MMENEGRILLAIDPGNVVSAYVFLDEANYKILDYGYLGNEEFMRKVVKSKYYDDMTVEMIASYGMSVGESVFDTCVWIGRFLEAGEQLGIKTSRVYRKDVKMNLCQSMRAKDSNIRQALIDRFGGQGTAKKKGPLFGITKDKLAALAVGVTWVDKHNNSPTSVL